MAVSNEAQRAVQLYKESVDKETWKPEDTVEAMKCVSLEENLGLGIGAFLAIKAFASRWIHVVFSDRKMYHPEDRKTLISIFETWLIPCPKVDSRISLFERKKYVVEGSEQFRRCLSEARKMISELRALDLKLMDSANAAYERGEYVKLDEFRRVRGRDSEAGSQPPR